MENLKRYDYIFGFKAIAVLLIIIDHFVFMRGIYTTDTFPITFFRDGMNGIYILFTICSYLVAKKILIAKERGVLPSLHQLYFDRVLKVVPPLYVYIIFLGLFDLFPEITEASAQAALTFTFNYLGKPHHNSIMHYWAFCAEETIIFALIIPIIYYLNKKNALRLLSFLAFISIFMRIGSYYNLADPNFFDWYKFMQTHLHLYGPCFGAIIAIISNCDKTRTIFNRYKLFYIGLLALILVSPYLEAKFMTPYLWAYKPVVSCVGFALLLFHSSSNQNSLFSKFMGNKLFIWLGSIYFSLYIWQQLYTFGYYNKDTPLKMIPVYAFYSFCLGLAAFLIIEKPLKILRKRLGVYF